MLGPGIIEAINTVVEKIRMKFNDIFPNPLF